MQEIQSLCYMESLAVLAVGDFGSWESPFKGNSVPGAAYWGLKALPRLDADQVCHHICSLVLCRWEMRFFQNPATYRYGESEDLRLCFFRKIPSLLSECSVVFSQRAVDLHVGEWLQGNTPLRKTMYWCLLMTGLQEAEAVVKNFGGCKKYRV